MSLQVSKRSPRLPRSEKQRLQNEILMNACTFKVMGLALGGGGAGAGGGRSLF